MATNEIAVRKRMQIAKTNRIMFLWIAISSALIGIALVVSIFLVQRLIYNEAVIAKKQETVSTLKHNLNAVDSLKQEVRKLDVNAALLSARANDSDQAIQVILDALPSGANSTALGSSLQKRLLADVSGLTLQTLQVDPVAGVETVLDSGASGDGSFSITFNFTVAGSQSALKKVLQNLELSIRTIEVTSLRITGQPGGAQEMSVQGRAFYEPAKTIEFNEEAI